MAALMLFAIESHSSSQRPCPNQSMKPTEVRSAERMKDKKSRVRLRLPWLISFSLGRSASEAARNDKMLDSGYNQNAIGTIQMKAKPSGKLRDGAQCKVIGGVHAGKSGIVTDINTSKTGHVTITVVQPEGERFKTLAENVVI